MRLSRHRAGDGNGARWALDGALLPTTVTLETLLSLPRDVMQSLLASLPAGEDATPATPLAPVGAAHEVWASGVTYLRSRDARRAESQDADVYERVYAAERPEIFFKAPGWRVRGPGAPIRVRRDSGWSVPEPELVLVLDREGRIVGYTAGNDVSSRDIEGENPLYLPQAKVYDGSCALGPAIHLLEDASELRHVAIAMTIERDGQPVFEGETNTEQLKRAPEELAEWLYRELSFPHGALLMTGTGLVPPDEFTLRAGDRVTVRVGELELVNEVAT
jgi:2-dehydro-3-deoxy-D-arabinonate dehydratase